VSKDKPNDTPARLAPHLALKLDALPVEFLKFPPAGYPDLPGKSSASSVTADPLRPVNKPYHVIEFIPDMDAFAVWFVRPEEPKQMVYVPTVRVLTWAPLL